MLEATHQSELASASQVSESDVGCVVNFAASIEPLPPEEDHRAMSIELLKDLSTRVLSLESDSRRNTSDIAAIKATLAHMPSKYWIAAWGLSALGALTLVQWRVISALLERLGA